MSFLKHKLFFRMYFSKNEVLRTYLMIFQTLIRF